MTILLFLAGALALVFFLRVCVAPGIALLGAAITIACASPALAQATAPTWSVWGALTPAVDQGASWLVGGALSAIGALIYAVFRVTLPMVLEARLRQTMLSGAHLLVLEAEEAAERAWTPERRRALVGQVVAYAMDRMPWAAARLKLTQRAVTGMAVKMLDQVLVGRSAAVSASPAGLASLPLLLPGAALGAIGSAPASGVAAAAACTTCGATDPERMTRGCTAPGCPQVPSADPVTAAVSAAASAALDVPTMLFGAAAPTSG